MNQNSWVTRGIITSYKHKRELYKELKNNDDGGDDSNNNNNNNNNPTVKSYCRDYSKIWFGVIKKTKRTEHDKFILNLYNETETTWCIINNQGEIKKEVK